MDERIARAVMGTLRERDRSGYDLWRWLGPVHGASVELTEATLYPILYRLEAERLIGGTWREADKTRRLYRLASRGVDMVVRRGWPAIARRTETDPILTVQVQASSSAAAVAVPAALPTPTPSKPEEVSAVGAWGVVALAESTPLTEKPRAKSPAVAAYLDGLEAGLRLAESDRVAVRDEIRHHLEDSAAAVVELGLTPAAAVNEAIARLGPPEVLAEAVNSAKLTRVRLVKGLRAASIAALFGGALGLAVAGTLVSFTPLVARLLHVIAGVVGVHLYAPETGVWWSQQLFLAASVAAFLAARRSLPFVALHTGRAETTVRPIWALAGGVPLAVLALLLPASLDTMVVVALLSIPVGFVAGTWLSQGHEDDLVSRKGIVGATLLLGALLLAPGFRMWVFDPAAGPSSAAPPISAPTKIAWNASSAGHNSWIVSTPGLDTSAWHDAKLEFWPASRQGVAIVPDASVNQPTFAVVPGATVDLSRFDGPNTDWWVNLTAVGPDGVRHTLTTDIHFGSTGPGPHSILSQMLKP